VELQDFVQRHRADFSRMNAGDRVQNIDISTLGFLSDLQVSAFSGYNRLHTPEYGDVVIVDHHGQPNHQQVGVIIREGATSLVLFPDGSTSTKRKSKAKLKVLQMRSGRGNEV